jgi:hypothetical protein
LVALGVVLGLGVLKCCEIERAIAVLFEVSTQPGFKENLVERAQGHGSTCASGFDKLWQGTPAGQGAHHVDGSRRQRQLQQLPSWRGRAHAQADLARHMPQN